VAIQPGLTGRDGERAVALSPGSAQVRRGWITPDRAARPYHPNAPLTWLIPGAVFLFAAHYVAVVAGAWYAFTDWNGLSTPNVVGLRNFEQIFGDSTARAAFVNTIVLAITFVVAANLIGLLLALGLHRAVRTRNILRSAFFAPIALSPLAVSYIWQFIFSFDGALNYLLQALGLGGLRRPWVADPSAALWTIFVVLVWQFSGLMMMFYLAGLNSIPEEVDEAAAVDGAGALARVWHVTLPLLAPSLTIALTFSAITGLRVFDQVIALTNGGPAGVTETLATQVYKQTWTLGRFGYGAAFALLLSLFVAIVAIAQLIVLRRREQSMA
jgi:raffinose/stachyose/melibiose transport system permease protein